jgi:putative zinc finger/helix-turn-helix YgiT family protein
MCENKEELKKGVTTLRYKDCGLENVTLHGVEYFKCPDCGEVYYSFGDIEKLHQTIARVLIQKKTLLNGHEVRFLRSYLGYSGTYFARLTGYAKESISRMENGKQKIIKPFDRLVRSMVATRLPDRDYHWHDLWLREEGKSLKRIELRAKNKGWILEEAA